MHGEGSEFALERKGRRVMIDPLGPPTAADIVVLTGATAWRVRGTLAALKAGVALTVVAQPALEAYLSRHGTVIGGGSREVEGLSVRLTHYAPTAQTRPREHLLKATVAAVRPAAALRRLAESAQLPGVQPSIIQLTFPDGSRLLHLDLSLHGGTPEAWLTMVAAEQGNADWTLAGIAYGEGAAFVQRISRVGGNRLLLAEITNGERRDLGLPTELVTPWRDRLHAAGLETHVFATRTSVRFE